MADDWNVDRGEDGRLIAEGWHGFSCEHCGGYHIELLDADQHVFAVMLVEGEDLAGLGNILLKVASDMVGKVFNGAVRTNG